jgi:tetratricopeptide (TPR) repeat protein
MPIPDVIRRLWGLARRALYIEFPWSIDEPSIRAQTQLTEERYSADLIFEELDRAFQEVRLVTFVRGLGLGAPSKRALVRAAGPRPEYAIAELMPGTASIGRLGEHSSNYIAPLLSPNGMKLFKQVSRHSYFSQLPFETADALLREIAAIKPACLVVPEELAGKYLIQHAGWRYTILPYVNRRRVSFSEFSEVSRDHVVQAILRLRRDLRALPTGGRSEFATLAADRVNHVLPVSTMLSNLPYSPELKERFWRLLHLGIEVYPSAASEICHGDLQESNIVIDEAGEPHVVDLDTLTLGTKFTDALCALAWIGASLEDFSSTLAKLEEEEGAACSELDFAISVMMFAHWSKEFEGATGDNVASIVGRAEAGLKSLLSVAHERVAQSATNPMTTGTAPAPDRSRTAELAAAKAASDAKEWRRAAELWDRLRRDLPQDARCWHKTGEAYCEAGMFEHANRILDEALARFPDDEWSAYWHVVVARRRADWPEALRRAEKMRQAFPDSWRPMIEAAEALAGLERRMEAEEMWREAVKRFPDQFWTNFHVARMEAARSDPPDAVRIWSELVASPASRPNRPQARRGAAHSAWQLHRRAAMDPTRRNCNDRI